MSTPSIPGPACGRWSRRGGFGPGATHTNLVFDIVVPYKFGECDDDLKKQISDEVEKRLPQHKCVIKCDNSFV